MYLPLSILAFILNGVAVTVDKFLLTKIIRDPLFYIFYFSAISPIAILFIPFTKTPSTEVFILSSLFTILWTNGAYFMYKALKVGQVQRVIPIIGTLNPLILFLIGIYSSSFLIGQVWAIILLILGMVFLTLRDWKGKITKEEIIFEVVSAILFAFSYLALKEAYLKEGALTVLVWSRFVLIPVAVIFLSVPILRSKVIPSKNEGITMLKSGGLLFVFGQICAGISQLLIFFAISLTNPALVNSLQGVQYIFLFILAIILSKKFPEIFTKESEFFGIITKVLGILFIGFGLFLLTFQSI